MLRNMKKKMDKWIYLSYPLGLRTPAYGGGNSLEIRHEKSLEKGDTCNSSCWCLPNHLGTHIDFPGHFVETGKTSDDYFADHWFFCTPIILDISSIEPDFIIKPEDLDLDAVDDNVDILIIKTGFSRRREDEVYWKRNPGFASCLATSLRARFPFLRVLGFDSISLSSYSHREVGREAHKAFLDNPHSILLLEDMDLSMVNSSSKLNQVILAPLRVEEAGGAPCTIFANISI